MALILVEINKNFWQYLKKKKNVFLKTVESIKGHSLLLLVNKILEEKRKSLRKRK